MKKEDAPARSILFSFCYTPMQEVTPKVVAIAVNTVLITPVLRRHGTMVVMGWYYFIGLAITLPHFGHRLSIDELLRLPLLVQGELTYLLLFGTVWPMWLLYRGAEHLTATHTALYRYIQPLVAGTLAHLRHQAQFDATNITALGLLFVGILNACNPCYGHTCYAANNVSPTVFYSVYLWYSVHIFLSLVCSQIRFLPLHYASRQVQRS